MRSFVSVWITLALTTLVQIGTILSIRLGENLVNPTLGVIATVLMVLSVILFFALSRGKLVPLVMAGIAGVLFILFAFQLKDTLPVVVTERGLAGVSLWKAMYRHMSPALIPLFLFPIFWDYHTDRQLLRRAEADLLTPSYFESTDDATEEETHKPKRSVRARARKNSEDSQ